jgi:hypothetical protein
MYEMELTRTEVIALAIAAHAMAEKHKNDVDLQRYNHWMGLFDTLVYGHNIEPHELNKFDWPTVDNRQRYRLRTFNLEYTKEQDNERR